MKYGFLIVTSCSPKIELLMSFDSYALINLKLQLPPPLPHGNQQAFDCHLCLWVRYLNLAGWDGAFELGGSSLQHNTQV